jgi:4-amino-4-deoxy-L-arabinose transferase-like glycosyltransferase
VLVRTALIGLLTSNSAPLTGDEPHYDGLARSLVAGQGLTYHGRVLPERAPGYPVVLAGIYKTLGTDRRTVAIVQGLFDAGTAWLTAAVASWVFASPLAGALAFLIVMLWPSFVQTSMSLYAESLFTLGLAAIVYGFARFQRAPSWGWAIVTGAIAGVVTLVRPTALSLVAGLGLGWMILRARHEFRQFPKLVAMGLVAAAAAAPSAIYNQRHYGVMTPGAIHGGEQFCLGALLETKGRWQHEVWWPIRRQIIADEAKRLGREPTVGEEQEAFFRHGLEAWKTHPLESVWITVLRVWRLVLLPVVGPDLPFVRIGFFVTLVALYVLAWPAAIAGFRTSDPARAYAGTITVGLLWTIVLLAGMYTISRYLEPERPMIIVLASGTLASFLDRRGVRVV